MKKYGRSWPPQFNALDIELTAFLHGMGPEQGFLGKYQHFRNVVDMLWPAGTRHAFTWHPWAEKMFQAACQWNYLSVSGPGGCGKSVCYAIWAIVNWLAAPMKTKVIVTSTTLSGAKNRIWGCITEYFNAVEGMPGKLLDSIGLIRTQADIGDGEKLKGSPKSGIQLIACDRSNASDTESIGKLIGIHNERVFLIGDELPELSESLVKAAKSNLSSNPYFQFIGIGNPLSRYDPHGVLSEPKGGWASIDESFTEWETKLGYAIRFDGEQSPNIIARKEVFQFLPTLEDMEEKRKDMGPDSLDYWRMFRGFWCPEGTVNGAVYSEADIALAGATETNVEWRKQPIPVSSCDPAWTNGGDETWATFGLFGEDKTGKQTLLVTEQKRLSEKKSDPSPRAFQIVRQWLDECRQRGIENRHMAYDSTGGGILFGDVLNEVGKDKSFYAVNFSDMASEVPVGSFGKPANELYGDRVSELWFVGRDFLRARQIFGLTPAIINDMTARQEDSSKRGGGTRRSVESKTKLKRRIKRSPDRGDSLMLLIDLCRARLKFRAANAKHVNQAMAEQWDAMKAKSEETDRTATPDNLADITNDPEPVVPHFPSARKAGRWQPEPDEEYDYGFGEVSLW